MALLVEMTYKDLQQTTLDYVKRPFEEMGEHVATALTFAQDYLQRKLKLKAFAFTQVYSGIPVVDGVATITPNVKLRNLEQAYLLSSGSSVADNPIQLVSAGQYHNLRDLSYRLSSRSAKPNEVQRQLQHFLVQSSKVFGYADGTDITIQPLKETNATVAIRGIAWLSKPEKDSSGWLAGKRNVLTESCAEFLVYKALLDLELFLKNDVRFDTLSSQVQRLYDSVEQWNQSFDDHSTTFNQ